MAFKSGLLLRSVLKLVKKARDQYALLLYNFKTKKKKKNDNLQLNLIVQKKGNI